MILTQADLPTSNALTARAATARDGRLDFWRGLCLIDMVVVHLLVQGLEIGHYPHAILGEYTRFAAGGFIFIAGLSVGRIFLPRAYDNTTRAATYQKLLRRAFYILCVHYLATLGFMVFSPLRGEPLPPIHRLVMDIILLREGYDLLPFYVVMLAAAPLMVESIRRGFGWLLAVASVALFAWGRHDPSIGFVPIQQTFFVVLWQAVFVAGLLFGAALPAYDKLAARWKTALASTAVALTVALSTMSYGWHFGLPRVEWIEFAKVPLSVGEALRYVAFTFAIVLMTDRLWRHIDGSAVARFAGRLGRRSLAIYVAHVFVVGLLVPLSYKDALGFTGHLLFYIPAALLSVWTIAWFMDRKAAVVNVAPARSWGLVVPQFPGRGMAVVAMGLILVLGVWAQLRPMGSGPTWDATDALAAGMDDPYSPFDRPLPLSSIGPRFLSPVTPGILPQYGSGVFPDLIGGGGDADHVAADDDEEGTAYARAGRAGRVKGDLIGGGPFRRQL
jgi:hypothetical protein